MIGHDRRLAAIHAVRDQVQGLGHQEARDAIAYVEDAYTPEDLVVLAAAETARRRRDVEGSRLRRKAKTKGATIKKENGLWCIENWPNATSLTVDQLEDRLAHGE